MVSPPILIVTYPNKRNTGKEKEKETRERKRKRASFFFISNAITKDTRIGTDPSLLHSHIVRTQDTRNNTRDTRLEISDRQTKNRQFTKTHSGY